MIFRSKVPTLLTMGSTQPLRPEGVSKERKKERKKEEEDDDDDHDDGDSYCAANNNLLTIWSFCLV